MSVSTNAHTYIQQADSAYWFVFLKYYQSIFGVKIVHGHFAKIAMNIFILILYYSAENVRNVKINLAGMVGQGPALPSWAWEK